MSGPDLKNMFPINVSFSDGETDWISRAYLLFPVLLKGWLGYFLLLVAYILSPLHPLHSFPGPRIARATYLYEAYFDLYKGGRYTHQIIKLHQRYGPLIRINPGALHCNDPHFVDEVYAGGSRKRNKTYFQVKHLVGPYVVNATRFLHLSTLFLHRRLQRSPSRFLPPSRLRDSAFGTVDHELHRRRREALRRFFSKAAVGRVERDLHGLAQQLGDRMLATGGDVFVLQDAMSCYTSDGIGLHSFGEPLGFLRQQRGFVPNLRRSARPIFETYHVFQWLTAVRYLFERFGK